MSKQKRKPRLSKAERERAREARMQAAKERAAVLGGGTLENPALGTKLTLDIDERAYAVAVRNNAGKCVVAQSIRLKAGEFTSVDVTSETARFNFRGIRYSYTMPAKARLLVVRFDELGIKELCKIQLQRPTRAYVESHSGKRGPNRPKGERKQVVGARCPVRRIKGLKVIPGTVPSEA